MINFISAAAIEFIVALFFVSRKQMDFIMMLLFILLIQPSINLNYAQLPEVNLPFISINKLHHQVISINLPKLNLRVQTEITIESTN